MTREQVKSQAQAKLAELATQSNLLSEIQDACEENGEWTLATLIEKEQDELTILRRAVRIAIEKI